MGNTSGNTNMRREIWIRKVLYEASQEMYFAKHGMVSTEKYGGNGILLRKDDLKKEKGDKITCALAMLLGGEGRDGDDEMKGHEQEMTVYDFSFYVNQNRQSVRLAGRMDEQKTAYNQRDTAKNRLKLWFRRKMEKEIFRKLAGVTSYTFSNTPTAPSTNRILYGGDATSQATIDSSDKFDTTVISKAKVLAETEVSGRPIIEPVMTEDGEVFVCFVHNYQAYDLFQDSVWQQAQREAALRGKKNPIFTGALGVWDGVVIHKHPFVPTYSTWGATSDQPGARALFCGKQAAAFGFGGGKSWNEETDDRGNKWVITGGGIWGVQKTIFNSEDFGVISLDTYAVNPNA